MPETSVKFPERALGVVCVLSAAQPRRSQGRWGVTQTGFPVPVSAGLPARATTEGDWSFPECG